MKVGVVGKGGGGKTTLAALLARHYAGQDRRVLAIDTDSDPNLGLSLGLSLAEVDEARALPHDMLVGSRGDMTPTELLRDYGVDTPAGPLLLHAGGVTTPGAGCSCSTHRGVRTLLGTAIEQEAAVTVVDMDAGLEHLSRSGATLAYADVLLVVTEPTRKAVWTAARTQALADTLGIPRILTVGSKIRPPKDTAFLEALSEQHGLRLVGSIPYDPGLVEADRTGVVPVDDQVARAHAAVVALAGELDAPEEQRRALHRQQARIDRRLAQLEERSA